MAVKAQTVSEICERAKRASHKLAAADPATREAALEEVASELEARAGEVLEANAQDLEAGRAGGLDTALLDRLELTQKRLDGVVSAVREIVALPDPVGEVIERSTLPNGLDLKKVRTPLGVIAIVYEARPNVTVDAAALAIKSGNAIVLRGSSTAQHSNAVLAGVVSDAFGAVGLPEGSISLLASGDRNELAELAVQDGLVDLIIPRGGEGLKNALKQHATVPVIYAAAGNCHVYIDASAEPTMARQIAFNAKVQRPGVCNAAETLLVHADVAPKLLEKLFGDLRQAGVELIVDARSRTLAASQSEGLLDATEFDWQTEYHALKLAVKIVDNLDEAIDHINRYGTGHSDAIVTSDDAAAARFTAEVDSACVYVNASTRFTDGGEFGLGAEMGNSTQKLHARGPIALRELTTYKYVVHGTGQVRE